MFILFRMQMIFDMQYATGGWPDDIVKLTEIFDDVLITSLRQMFKA